jgi:hypothetical protein
MNRARDRREGTPAYEEYLRDRQAELDAEKAAADAAAANDPVAMAQRAMDAEAEATRALVLTGRLSDRFMSDFGAVVREPSFTEAQVENALNEFKAQTPDYVQTKANAAVLVEFIYRNNLSPGARTSYRLAHKILALWNWYVDEVAPQIAQEAAPVAEVVPVLSRSEQAILDHQKFMEEIVGTDEMGKQWTAFELDRLPAKEELRLRRLFEEGHRGSNLLTVRREILDVKQQQDAERARIAAEQEGGN